MASTIGMGWCAFLTTAASRSTPTVERSMRPIALNRKNALFAGSDEGAANWAMLASLVETCKLHGVNPEATSATC